jgi:hypothetical protein
VEARDRTENDEELEVLEPITRHKDNMAMVY